MIGLGVPLARHERVAGAAGFGLADGGPVADVCLRLQVVFDVTGQIVDHYDQPIHRRERADDPVEDRPALHGQQRLRNVVRVRAKAGAFAGGENVGVHVDMVGEPKTPPPRATGLTPAGP